MMTYFWPFLVLSWPPGGEKIENFVLEIECEFGYFFGGYELMEMLLEY